jgi:hypothetical protein
MFYVLGYDKVNLSTIKWNYWLHKYSKEEKFMALNREYI